MLAGCGGGDGELSTDSGSSGTTTEVDAVATSVTLLASSQQLASSGAQVILLTAIAKDSNNNLLEGVTINFSATSGDIGFVVDDEGNDYTSSITGSDGKVIRNLSTETDSNNRVITVEVKSGNISDSIDISVVGTTISLSGTSVLAINDVSNYTIKLLDSDGIGLAGALVELSLSGESSEAAGSIANITLPTEEVRTDANGQVKLNIVGTSEGTNSIIATAFGATTTAAVSVQADTFLFTAFGNGTQTVDLSSEVIPDVLLSKTATATLTWLRSGASVPDGTVVSFTTTRGTLASASTTTVAGKATATITSTNAGSAILTFTGTTTVNGKTIELNNQLEFEFIADSAHRLIAQAFPVSISPNGQTSTVSVTVRDSAGNLVKNKTIDFDLDDVSNGSIYPASAVTDSNGSASTVYTSNSTSAFEGISVKATVRGATPEISDTVNITVADREVFIALGTGNSIVQSDINTYNKQYSVFVTDIDSTPIANVDLTVSAIPKEYYKGSWGIVLNDEGKFDHYAPFYSTVCANEDVNKNGILDDLDFEEDTNGNGQLTPGNIVNAQGTVTTDADGRAMIDIEYAEVFGGWANIDLIVSTKVNGTESFAKVVFNLDILAADVVEENVPPAAFIWPSGPFGMSSSCADSD